MRFTSGTRLGPYEIVSPLGAGGMGEVYKAHDPRLGRNVAIKVLPQHLAESPDSLGRFEREARAVAALSHPNIVAIYDVGRSDLASYVVTELLEGETLRAVIGRGPVSWRKAVETAIAVCDGLSAAHSKGIIHRDLKPENLFVSDDNRIKILDFGLARIEATNAGHELRSSSKTAVHTRSGEIMGTVGYMSPEQLCGEVTDPRTDIFSLGCILYEMIAGQRPFARPTTAEMMTAILRDEPPDLSDSGQSVPPELAKVILHCLAKSRNDRFLSARDLALTLQALLSSAETGRSTVRRAAKPAESIAVLPFRFPAGNQDGEQLADVLSLELINQISSLPKVRVLARSKTSRYRGTDADPQEVGRELNVRAVVSGSILARGDSFLVQAELVGVVDGSQLWGGQWRVTAQQTTEISAVAADMVTGLREKLGAKRSRQAARPKETPGPSSAPASEVRTSGSGDPVLLARVNELLGRGSDEALKQAVALLEELVARSGPGGQRAIANRLAYAYALLAWRGAVAAGAVAGKARSMLGAGDVKATTTPDFRLASGVIAGVFEWDWKTAGERLREAVATDPERDEAHLWLGSQLVATGKTADGVAATDRALELDPLSLSTALMAAETFYMAGHFDRAMAHARRALIADSGSIRGRALLALVHTEEGHAGEAIGELQDLINEPDTNPEALAALGCAYARAGKRGGAMRMLGRLRDSRRRYTSPVLIAAVHAQLGETEAALAALELAFEQRSPALVMLAADPRLRPLRSHPRFEALVRRMALA